MSQTRNSKSPRVLLEISGKDPGLFKQGHYAKQALPKELVETIEQQGYEFVLQNFEKLPDSPAYCTRSKNKMK